MNVIKEYNTAKKRKGNVCFGSIHAGAWVFRCSDKESGSFEKIIRIRGGIEMAEKIALVISKSWLRTAGKKLNAPSRLDGTARRAIDNLCHLRTLKDWKDEPEWWANAIDESVKQVYFHRQPTARPVVASEGISEADLLTVGNAGSPQELTPA